MSTRETAEEIEAAAANWVIRLDGHGSFDGEVGAAFAIWAAGDDRRRGAYVRALAAWRLLDRARALPAEGNAEYTVMDKPRRPSRRMLLGEIAIAASAASLGAAFWFQELSSDMVETATSKARRITLADGSIAWLDARTTLKIRYGPRKRSIELVSGQAWFEVAKNARRPFVIRAGSAEARAVGTAFSVSRRDESSSVLVTEGVVEFRGTPGSGSAQSARLHSGMQGRLSADGAIAISQVEPDTERRLLAWREGRIALAGETLAEAAAIFNRYNALQIVVDDRALGQERLVGWFVADRPMDFVEAVELSLGATVARSADKIVLTREKI